MKGYSSLIKKLKAIKKMGYIKTHRAGNTGIGKTLEDLLGITENNIPGPNAQMIELKSARKNVSSMLTLFTKSPLPRKANSVLLERFGYESRRGNHKKELHTTVSAKEFNTLKGKTGFKIVIEEDRINLVTSQNEVVGYWDKETLKKSFERKIPKLLYVKADSRGSGSNEKFWFNEAWLLSGFNFGSFVRLLQEGTILVDIRIGQYPDGRAHDHGTGFRVLPAKLDLCFKHREKIL
ncbi:MvaI/BcnI family restriction endonuclease [Caldisericum sp.]|uniref:MvaI/BcnI family restriction endonuclease n=1 Tax=Caldisericum sp. TaxID=2499687 RepID=UPI003D0CEF05